MSYEIANVEHVPMPQHGRLISLEELRQIKKFNSLAEHWSKFDEYRLRVMQQIAGVLKHQERALEGRNLDALEALHNEFCGGDQ